MVARAIDLPSAADIIATPYNPDPVLLAIVQIIRDGLLRDQHVRLHNFGTFRLRWSKQRRIKHPKTGEYVIATPTPKISFTPAKYLRDKINPNPKPVIPLDEPINLATNNKKQSDDKSAISMGEGQTEEYNLRETVQNIIDEEYNPADTASSIITDKTAIHDTDNIVGKTSNSINKKWAWGLLAAVPLMLVMLQTDFSTNNSEDQIAVVVTDNKTEATVTDNVVSSNKIVRTETAVSTNTTKTTHETNQPIPDSTSVATPRPEPTPKPFYMSPQLHTVEQGDNLWGLAKEFYGDALLWPHIYRANMRTLNDPDLIATGKQLVIPGLQQSPETLSTRDRELIAEGYFKVYQFNKAKHSQQAIYFLIGAKQYSFEWLTRNRQNISHTDWMVIEKH